MDGDPKKIGEKVTCPAVWRYDTGAFVTMSDQTVDDGSSLILYEPPWAWHKCGSRLGQRAMFGVIGLSFSDPCPMAPNLLYISRAVHSVFAIPHASLGDQSQF